MIGEFLFDVKYALRGLLRNRGFAIVALLSIGLGAGANSAIFSLVDQALLRQLPVRDPERLVLLNWSGSFIGHGWGSGNLLPHPLYRDLSAANQMFDGMFCRAPFELNLSVGGAPEPVQAELVSGSYFPVLGVRPALGRLLDESDDRKPGAHPVVVVSFDFWKNRLGGAADVVGRKFVVNNHPMTVIGVAAPGFRGVDWGEVPSLWIPVMMQRETAPFEWLQNRRGRWLHIFGRLKPGVTQEQARAGLRPWFKAMLEEDTKREGWPSVTETQRRAFLASELTVLPGAQGRSDLRRRLEQPLLVLMSATGLVLLLACLNVANLSLARAFARRKETALRSALGASRGRIAREWMIESILVALGGAVLGVVFAPLVTRALIAFLTGEVDLSAAVNPRVFVFTLAVALATGLLFGLAPAIQASRAQPAMALKEKSASGGGAALRKALVAGQIALALILLVGAGLFVRTLANLRAQGPGFDMTNLLAFRIEPARNGYPDEKSKPLFREMLSAVRALPEVKSVGLSSATLLAGGSWNTWLTIDAGQRIVTDGLVHCNAISPGFLATLGASLVSGRDFTERDDHDDRVTGFRSAIVNESFARRYFGDRNPIGARLGFGNSPDARTPMEIVGVVRTFSYRGIRETEQQAFFPLFEGFRGGAGFYVRTRVDSQAAVSSIRAAVRQVDGTLPMMALRTLDDQLDRSLMNERLLATLATAFAGLAVLLAVVGLYGVISFVATQRTREIGIRLALGGSRRGAVWLIVRDAGIMVTVGVAIAVPAIWGLSRLVASQLFGVGPMDGLTIAAAGILVALVALAASALPARRASSVNPVEALRYE